MGRRLFINQGTTEISQGKRYVIKSFTLSQCQTWLFYRVCTWALCPVTFQMASATEPTEHSCFIFSWTSLLRKFFLKVCLKINLTSIGHSYSSSQIFLPFLGFQSLTSVLLWLSELSPPAVTFILCRTLFITLGGPKTHAEMYLFSSWLSAVTEGRQTWSYCSKEMFLCQHFNVKHLVSASMPEFFFFGSYSYKHFFKRLDRTVVIHKRFLQVIYI